MNLVITDNNNKVMQVAVSASSVELHSNSKLKRAEFTLSQPEHMVIIEATEQGDNPTLIYQSLSKGAMGETVTNKVMLKKIKNGRSTITSVDTQAEVDAFYQAVLKPMTIMKSLKQTKAAAKAEELRKASQPKDKNLKAFVEKHKPKSRKTQNDKSVKASRDAEIIKSAKLKAKGGVDFELSDRGEMIVKCCDRLATFQPDNLLMLSLNQELERRGIKELTKSQEAFLAEQLIKFGQNGTREQALEIIKHLKNQ